MNFASSHVYMYDESDEEFVSDDEYEAGVKSSDSEEEEERVMPTAVSPINYSGRGGAFSFGARDAPHSPPDAPPALPAPRGARYSLMGSLFGSRRQASAPVKKKKAKKVHKWKIQEQCDDTELYDAQVVTNKRYWRRADTNVVSVQLDELVSPSNMHTGDFVRCHNCKGVMSHVSKVTDSGDDKVWGCDFCGSVNVVDIVEEEIPKMEDVTYMLAPAPTTTASGKSGIDESLVVFCMDTSGSMCVTTEVAGRIALRGDKTSKMQSLNDTGESQWMPGQRRNVTYVSRLQSTQAAVDHQLETMAKEYPDRRVALVTFNSSVTYIGDGLQEEKILSGDKLGDREQITACGKELSMPDCVKKGRDTLGKKLFDLEEKGQTALGPALLLSVVMACRQAASKVIICTDGMANVGLGSLDTKSDEAAEASSNFYTDVANLALEQGVSVSVITIEGTDCKLAELGRVADITGGQVNIVKPENLTKEFGTILAEPIVATNVTAVFAVHNQLYIRDRESEDSLQSNWTERVVGNVTADTEITFEFGAKRSPKRKHAKNKGKPKGEVKEEGSAEGATKDGAASGSSKEDKGPKDLPFQIQITYTDLEGAKAMRVLTQKKPVTKERQEAEKNVNFDVLGVNAVQQTAQLAQQGKFAHARLHAMMNKRLLYRNRQSGDDRAEKAYKGYTSHMAPVVDASKVEEELNDRVVTHDLLGSSGVPQPYKLSVTNRSVSDSSANIFYSAKKMPSKGLKRPDDDAGP